MECERCSVCSRTVPSSYLCSYVLDGGQSYATCFCVCEDCRRYMVERSDLTLWGPR